MQLLAPLLISFVLRTYGHGYLTRAVPRTGQTYNIPTNNAGKARLARDLGYAWTFHDIQGKPLQRACTEAEKNANPKTCYWRGDPTACVLGGCAVPINQRLNDLFVCRGPDKNPDVLQVQAGSSLDFRYLLAADHLGDCDVFISYDVNAPMQQKQFFKIANVPQCEKAKYKMSQADCAGDALAQPKCDQMFHATITLPAWLPAGEVILRFGWVAVHPFPNIEYYADCVDAVIQPGASPIALSSITKYPLRNAFPPSSCDHRGTAETNWQEKQCPRGSRSKNVYRCNWQPPSGPCAPDPETWMLGPECANRYAGNDCAATQRGTEGNTLQDATSPTANPGTGSPPDSTGPTEGPTGRPTEGPTPGPTSAPDPDGVPESMMCSLVKNLEMSSLGSLAEKASTGETQWSAEEVCAAIAKYCKNAACAATSTPTVPSEKEELLEGLFFEISKLILTEQGPPQGGTTSPSGAIGAVNSAPNVGALESLSLLGMIYLLL